ncbi:hypothetical protein BH09SUM1_BH09SUM1_10870 [soil metagenome]
MKGDPVARIANISACVVVFLVLLAYFGMNLIRFKAAKVSMRVTTARNDMKEMQQLLEARVTAGNPLPPLQPLGASADRKTFGPAIDGVTKLDIFSTKGEGPFAAESDGGMFVLYSPGPDGVFDLQKETLKTALSSGNIEPLDVVSYDATNGTVSEGDIYRTNMQSADRFSEQLRDSKAARK